jgi:DHA1 family bicyclomycin/chloramphenicol resistance-like MFS transporter
MYLPAFPTLAAELSATPAEVQRTLATFLLGISLGQLGAGPLSDRFGRRPPVFAGLAVYAMASFGCALAAGVESLAWLRLLQALGGCVGMVVSRAVMRDLCDERGMVRMGAMLMLVMGAAPILAPMPGAWLLALGGWRVIFWGLGIYALLAMLAVALFLPESLPSERRRRRDGLALVVSVYLSILRDRRFLSHALAGAIPMTGLFAYLFASPVVLMEGHGLGPVEYGLAFGANAFGLILASQVVARLVRRVAPARRLVWALACCATAGLAVPAAVATGALTPLLAVLFLYLSTMGAVLPLAGALAMGPLGRVAGSGSAVLGTLQFGLGSAVGTSIGAAGGGAWVMAGVLGVAGCAGLATHLVLRRVRPPA